jgi:calcineurin-like phosphoesterase family protein
MTHFLTGCTHFGHKGILNYTSRPYASVEEMDQALVDNWNKTVNSGDTVIHLGDFGWEGSAGVLRRLNGHVILLQGNHDKPGWGKDYMELAALGRKWVLMHYPIEEWNGYFKGALHCHAHTHKTSLASGHNRFNVGVDATGLKPISLDELVVYAEEAVPFVKG